MNNICKILCAFLLGGTSLSLEAKEDLVDYVNTLQGTNSKFELTHGNTYATTAYPWGMNFWTPQTGLVCDGWIYQHFKDSIRGFRQTHQCSSWTNDYGAFSIMPVIGNLKVDQYGRAAHFSHEQEIAKPHYYKVSLDKGLIVELAPTERGAFFRFTYPKNEDAYLVLDGHGGENMIRIYPNEQKIVGFTKNGNHSCPKGFANYFVLYFDKPFKSYGTWTGEGDNVTVNSKDVISQRAGSFVQFEPGKIVNVKIISSFISIDQAELNYKRELLDLKSLEQAKEIAGNVWNEKLGKIEVYGGTEEEKATFYSCFFRSMLFPRKFYEYNANGKPIYYSPYDGTLHEGYMYTDNGFWDTFRAQFPLNALLHPKMHQQYIQSLLDAYDQSGWLPSWSFPGHNCGMVGNHAASLLADAYVKGFSFDEKKALQAMLHEATKKGPYGPSNGRDCWEDYFTIGYVPFPESKEAVAKTLEFCYDDFCAMRIAELSGNLYYRDLFKKQVLNYKNIFDPSTRFFRGKNRVGQWTSNFDPKEWGGPYTEGCAWHYRWSVFHDIQGLINLMGGDNKFVAALDSVFSEDNTFKVGTYGFAIHEMNEMSMINMGQYAHGNQPIQHMIYLYNYAKAPWKTQYWVRQVMNRLYSSGPDGYPGDEDQGQTSSWFVISAMGFYSVCPGTDQYVIGSPLFPKMRIHFENGKTLEIIAKDNNLNNCYIKYATFNERSFTRNWLSFQELKNGGVIKYQMDNHPNKQRGVESDDKPYSFSLMPLH